MQLSTKPEYASHTDGATGEELGDQQETHKHTQAKLDTEMCLF